MTKTKKTAFRPNTLVMYEGGGYDGCIWEYNYAFIEDGGESGFHDIASNGVLGCSTFDDLKRAFKNRPNDFDLYHLDTDGEAERFGREAPISHLLVVARFLSDMGVEIPVKCDSCGLAFDASNMLGYFPRGIGGIVSEYRQILCENCACGADDE